MQAQFYFIHEVRNILFARLISPNLAAFLFSRAGRIVLATPADLRDLAARRDKLLHVSGLALARRRAWQAEAILA